MDWILIGATKKTKITFDIYRNILYNADINKRKDKMTDLYLDTKADGRTEERRNRFNGESVMLTKEEARKNDEIFMHELQATIEDKTLGTGGSKHWQKMRDKLSWFMKHNAKAYMVLLD